MSIPRKACDHILDGEWLSMTVVTWSSFSELSLSAKYQVLSTIPSDRFWKRLLLLVTCCDGGETKSNPSPDWLGLYCQTGLEFDKIGFLLDVFQILNHNLPAFLWMLIGTINLSYDLLLIQSKLKRKAGKFMTEYFKEIEKKSNNWSSYFIPSFYFFKNWQ